MTDTQLPPLWLSLLPVLLPVMLISSHTIANVFAKAELVDLLTIGLKENAVVAPEGAKALAQDLATAGLVSPTADVDGLAKQLLRQKIAGTAQRADQLAQDLIRADVFVALEATPRPAQGRANVTAILGSPNLALLLSAVIAMGMLVWKRRLPLKALAQKVDQSLMSGGVIILITAGGGAFGAMLGEAGIQTMIEQRFSGSSENAGMMIFFLAFGVSAMLKFAQGSSTVAMMTTSSMFAAMGVTSEMLGCNLVYLATAIGGGALVGSWMNDSGFWIISRMGVLTETEALKSWTILLATLGITSFGFTLLFSRVLPLV